MDRHFNDSLPSRPNLEWQSLDVSRIDSEWHQMMADETRKIIEGLKITPSLIGKLIHSNTPIDMTCKVVCEVQA